MDNLDESRKDLLGKHEIAETEPTETIDDYKELKEEQNEYLLKFQTICSSNA
jgi:hypothetical protein